MQNNILIFLSFKETDIHIKSINVRFVEAKITLNHIFLYY